MHGAVGRPKPIHDGGGTIAGWRRHGFVHQGGKIMRMRQRVWGVLSGLVLVVLGIGLVWYEGPLLLRDFAISSNMEAATQRGL